MRFKLVLLLAVLLFFVSCSSETSTPIRPALLVTDGTTEKSYGVEDLEAMEASQAEFQEVAYVGVKLSTLLQDAGFNPESVRAVKATADDGFTANYDPDLVNREDTLVAYARVDGPLSEEDGHFRMLLPDQEGKLNPRRLVELRVFE